MVREFSAGGVVLRRLQGRWWIAVIEPQGRKKKTAAGDDPTLALPKGMVDQGEEPQQTALREVREETGVVATSLAKLGDIKYFYVRSWGDRQRVFKVVSFFLLMYKSGRMGRIVPEMRKEVRRAMWIPLEASAERLSYRGEKEVAELAQKYVAEHPDLAG